MSRPYPKSKKLLSAVRMGRKKAEGKGGVLIQDALPPRPSNREEKPIRAPPQKGKTAAAQKRRLLQTHETEQKSAKEIEGGKRRSRLVD